MRLAAQPAPLRPGATSILGPAGAARVRAARLRASGSGRVSHPRTLDRLDCLARHLEKAQVRIRRPTHVGHEGLLCYGHARLQGGLLHQMEVEARYLTHELRQPVELL